MSRYQALALVTVVATLLLITLGSVVRTTGSGLGCPDWPLCHGRLLPPLERTAIIEYSHRTVAALVGALVVATVVTTLRVRRTERAVRALAVAALPLLALQAWLGKETVERELPPLVVTFHLSTALVLFAVLALVAALAWQGAERRLAAIRERRAVARLAVIAAVAMAVVIVSGAYVVGAHASFACSAWPGCPESPVPFAAGGRPEAVHWLHRLTVLAAGAAVALVVLAVWQLREPAPWLRRGALALGVLFLAQVLSGALNIWSELSEAARVLHLALGSALWAVLVVIAVAGRYGSAPSPADARAPAPAVGASRARA